MMVNQVGFNAPANTVMGFADLAGFELLERAANMFHKSSMVPATYREVLITEKMKQEEREEAVKKSFGNLANCLVALDMAQRMKANPIMVMQNLHVIDGRPSWSSQFIMAAINSSGKFSSLRFDLQWSDHEEEVQYQTWRWGERKGERITENHTEIIRDATCVAWATEKSTGARLESPPVSIKMAVKEGWYQKTGSKWKSMPEMMLRYRAAAFFGRIYAPELLMGLPAEDELYDTVEVIEPDGTKTTQSVKKNMKTVLDPEPVETKKAVDPYPDELFRKNLPSWEQVIKSGKKTVQQVIQTVVSRNPDKQLTSEQILVLTAIAIEPSNIVDAEVSEMQAA